MRTLQTDILALLRLFGPRVLDRETHAKVLSLAEEEESWSSGHDISDMIRDRGRSPDFQKDRATQYQYYFEDTLTDNVGLKMKRFALIACFFVAVGAVAVEPSRQLLVRGWEFSVPAFLARKVHDGPDFTVTYFSSEEKKMGMGIYEGGFPQEASKGRLDVRREEEKIAGQKVSWALWSDEIDGVKRVRFEVFLAVSPERPPSDKFHLFGYAASAADLDLLRSIVRSAHQKEGPTSQPQQQRP